MIDKSKRYYTDYLGYASKWYKLTFLGYALNIGCKILEKTELVDDK